MRSAMYPWFAVFLLVILAMGCNGSPASPRSTQQPTAGGAMAMTQDHERPFVGTVTGQASFDFTNPSGCATGFTTVTDATGTASHLGDTSFHSEHCVAQTGDFVGSLVLTAADGDQLHATYTGASTPPGQIGEPIYITATITISGGTGRFAGAAGTAEMTATVTFEGFDKLSWPGRWQWQGTISY